MNKRILLTLLLPALTFFLIGIQSINSTALAQEAIGVPCTMLGDESECPACEICKLNDETKEAKCVLKEGADCSGTRGRGCSPGGAPRCNLSTCKCECKKLSERSYQTTNKKGTFIKRLQIEYCPVVDDTEPSPDPSP